MGYPSTRPELERLRRYQQQKSWTNAQLATDLTAYGWMWNEHEVEMLMKGITKLSDAKKKYINDYLLDAYFDETLS